MPTDILKYIHPETVVVSRQEKTKPALLQKIADLSSKLVPSDPTASQRIYSALQNREHLGSTGIHNHIALPHCKVSGLDDFILGIVVSPDGIAYQSIDRKPAKLFFFTIAPESNDNTYLSIMAEIGNFLSDENRVSQLIQSKTDEELFATFNQLWAEYKEKER